MPADAKSLCQQLLIVDPHKRLGSGPKDSPLSYEMLKKHEFFKGIDFQNLPKVKPPMDAALRFKLQSERKVIAKACSSMDSPDEDASAESLEDGAHSTPKSKEDKLLMEGVVLKKCGWIFYKKRKLVLTSRPRLSYYDSGNGNYKGDVLLTKKVKAVKSGSNKFNAVTPNRTYYFEGLTPECADEWIKKLNDAIRDYCPELA